MAVLAGRGRRTSRLGNDYKARDEEGGVSVAVHKPGGTMFGRWELAM